MEEKLLLPNKMKKMSMWPHGVILKKFFFRVSVALQQPLVVPETICSPVPLFQSSLLLARDLNCKKLIC